MQTFHDLQQPKAPFLKLIKDKCIEVTRGLLEDWQTWLESNHEYYVREQEEQKEAEAQAVQRSSKQLHKLLQSGSCYCVLDSAEE